MLIMCILAAALAVMGSVLLVVFWSPLLRERSDQKGSSTSWCGRCKKPLTLRLAQFRSAFA